MLVGHSPGLSMLLRLVSFQCLLVLAIKILENYAVSRVCLSLAMTFNHMIKSHNLWGFFGIKLFDLAISTLPVHYLMPQVTLLYHGVHEQWLFQFTPAFYVSKSTFFRFFFFTMLAIPVCFVCILRVS